MTPDVLLSHRLKGLRELVAGALPEAPPQSQGFACRVLPKVEDAIVEEWLALHSEPYGGVPEVARLGFVLARRKESGARAADVALRFEDGLQRLRGRPAATLTEEIDSDDLVALGMAAGIACLDEAQQPTWQAWLSSVLGSNRSSAWTGRARDLAMDLVSSQGLLRATPTLATTDAMALEVVLRNAWPAAFAMSAALDPETHQTLLMTLIADDPPHPGELDRAVAVAGAFEVLLSGLARDALPSVEETTRLLEGTGTSFARWVWETESTRKGVAPTRWLLDKEPHVQAFLWAILRPVFGGDLVDEEYLPSYGLTQPRVDFGIVSLKLLIEVKFLRAPSDLKNVESEIAGDLGSYFSAPDRFDRLVVYVYDDSDAPEPEQYDRLRQALRRRDSRVVDVIFVQRPSVIPPRSERG